MKHDKTKREEKAKKQQGEIVHHSGMDRYGVVRHTNIRLANAENTHKW